MVKTILTPRGRVPLFEEALTEDQINEQMSVSIDSLNDQYVAALVEQADDLDVEISEENIEHIIELFTNKLKKMVHKRQRAASDANDANHKTHPNGYSGIMGNAPENRLSSHLLAKSVKHNKRVTRELPDGSHDYGKSKSTRELVALGKAKGKKIGLKSK